MLSKNEAHQLREVLHVLSMLQSIEQERLGERAEIKAEHQAQLNSTIDDPRLKSFYAKAEKEFESNWKKLCDVVIGSKVSGRTYLLEKIYSARPLFQKLDRLDCKLLAESLLQFAHAIADANSPWLSQLALFLAPFREARNENE